MHVTIGLWLLSLWDEEMDEDGFASCLYPLDMVAVIDKEQI